MENNSQLLKFEMVVQGSLRALIIKNCVASDFGKYEVLSGEERAETIFREESETPAAVKMLPKNPLIIFFLRPQFPRNVVLPLRNNLKKPKVLH